MLGYHQKIRVHTAGGRVMREHVDCPIDISGDYELPQSLLFLLALVGFAKQEGLKSMNMGVKAEVIFAWLILETEFTGQLAFSLFASFLKRLRSLACRDMEVPQSTL